MEARPTIAQLREAVCELESTFTALHARYTANYTVSPYSITTSEGSYILAPILTALLAAQQELARREQ